MTTVLDSELSGATKEVVSALLCPPVTYDVQSLNKAFEDCDYDTIVTIIISSKSDILVDIEEHYLTGECLVGNGEDESGNYEITTGSHSWLSG